MLLRHFNVRQFVAFNIKSLRQLSVRSSVVKGPQMVFIILFASYGSTQLGVSLKLTLPLCQSVRFYSTNARWSRDQSFNKTSRNYLKVSQNYLKILWKFQRD
jgi:uncharacterized membrane protein